MRSSMFWRVQDVAEKIKREEGGGREGWRKRGLEEERPWFLYPETPHNPPFSFPLISAPSLSPFNLPSTQLPSASYHGNRQRGRKRRETRSESERRRLGAKSTKEQRWGAEQICRTVSERGLGCLKEPCLLFLKRSSLRQLIMSARQSKPPLCTSFLDDYVCPLSGYEATKPPRSKDVKEKIAKTQKPF